MEGEGEEERWRGGGGGRWRGRREGEGKVDRQGCRAPYISLMLGAASMRDGGEKCDGLGTRVPRSPSATDSLARSLPGSECAFRVEGSYNPTILL